MEFYQSWSKSRFSSKSTKSLKGQGNSNGILAKLVKVSIYRRIDQILENTRRSLWNFTKVDQSQDYHHNLSKL